MVVTEYLDSTTEGCQAHPEIQAHGLRGPWTGSLWSRPPYFLSLGEQLVLLSKTPMHLKKAKQVGAGLTQLVGAMSMAW